MKKILIFLLILGGCSAVVKPLELARLNSSIDNDGDKVNDYIDIVENARAQIGVVTKYDTNYYSSAFPPADSGACADVIWRALLESGYDFKKMIDEDIVANSEIYPAKGDSNIDFRRVRNIQVFLEKNTESLTTEVIPGDYENMYQWQGGDIVTFEQIPGGLWHVAIVSDERRKDGVPLIIHNYGYGVKEDDYLLNWPTKINGHYRWMLKRDS